MNIAEQVLQKAGSLALQQIALAWGVQDDVDKLKRTLYTLKAVLSDAEQKQTTNGELGVWLDQLKEVCYDAEDVLDEFEVEDVRRQAVKHASIKTKVLASFSWFNSLVLRSKMARKIKDINERLDGIAATRDQFDLIRGGENQPILPRGREKSFSFVHNVDVIGREEEKENIIKLLLHSDDEEEENVSVIPIVGMGGLGKTAFAKLVFNDERVEKHFQLRIWVCVSEDFVLRKVIETLIKSATKGAILAENFSNLEMDALSAKLLEKIEGKRYLLVLDDVWNEDPSKWKELETLLRTGARGSKILVTTRSNKVAGIMGTVQAHKLVALSHQKCMSLFVKAAFKEGQGEHFPNLMEIGEHIVRKCRGVPLAVVTLANLLSSTTDEVDWIYVRDSEMWELPQKESYILPSLKLSYDQLPPHLKKCFAFCSMFPKGHLFIQWELNSFWMAHGLLEPENPNQEPEEVGLRYLKELGSRCFFQDFQDLNGFLACKMHDLVHDLALSVSRDDFLVVTSGSTRVSRNVRHLSLPDPDLLPQDLPLSLQNSDHFRSFGTFATENKGLVGSFVFSCLFRFKYLWVLDLINSKFEVLPKSISTLKHLRFLRISWNCDIKQLPNSICKLHSLQTLFFDGCRQIKELPRDINYMISLRHLAVTTQQNHLPKGGLGRLKSLRSLCFMECGNLEYLFEDMQGLVNLRRLDVYNCRKLISLPQGMKHLTSLRVLGITGCDDLRELPGCLKNLPLDLLLIENCPQLVERCSLETGEDWHKIAHIKKIRVDGIHIKSSHEQI